MARDSGEMGNSSKTMQKWIYWSMLNNQLKVKVFAKEFHVRLHSSGPLIWTYARRRQLSGFCIMFSTSTTPLELIWGRMMWKSAQLGSLIDHRHVGQQNKSNVVSERKISRHLSAARYGNVVRTVEMNLRSRTWRSVSIRRPGVVTRAHSN